MAIRNKNNTRINLLTIHWGNSYGGLFQTYATVKILESLHYKVTLINLIHPKYKGELLKTLFRSPALFIMTFWFHRFRQKCGVHFTRKMFKVEASKLPKCDFFVVGSDQVWNSDITNVIKNAYFLDFAGGLPRISLSSSFGKYNWTDDAAYTSWVKKQLNGFRAISVRDESGIEICKNIFNVKAIQLIDPTLAWGKYEEMINCKKSIHQVYPFLLIQNNDTDKICNLVSSDLMLPLYSNTSIKHFLCQSPSGWLNRMKNSDFIITDSFHGLAFSLLFHKQFIVLCADDEKFARLSSLLKLVHLEDRYVKNVEDLQFRKTELYARIDYSFADKILALEREKFVRYVTESINYR